MEHPPADLDDLDADTLRAALADVDPTLAARPLRRVAHGWDNDMWRLGDDLAVRVARRRAALELLTNECTWLTRLPSIAPAAMPSPIVHAPAGPDGAIRWSVVPWLDGTDLLGRAPAGEGFADDLATALARLHEPAPTDAPVNPVRGIPLVERSARVESNLDLLGLGELAGGVRRRAATLRPQPGPDQWLHGDVHPGNVVASADGRLVGLVDFGDLGRGDIATDLGGAWVLFDAEVRARFLDRYRGKRHDAVTDPDLVARAEWWAVSFCTAVLAATSTGPLVERCRTVWRELEPTVSGW